MHKDLKSLLLGEKPSSEKANDNTESTQEAGGAAQTDGSDEMEQAGLFRDMMAEFVREIRQKEKKAAISLLGRTLENLSFASGVLARLIDEVIVGDDEGLDEAV